MISRAKILPAIPVAICLMLAFSIQGKKNLTKMKNAKVVEIIDGDTIVVRQAQYKYRGYLARDRYMIDLAGIQALPVGTKIGKDAFTFLKRKLLNETVSVYLTTNMNGWIVKKMGYGDISEELVERGLAYRVNDNGLYAKAQASARRRNRGLWKEPDTAAMAQQQQIDPLPLDTYEHHSLPDYFHDIQTPVQEDNYVEKRDEFKIGHAYDLVITGLDYFYERATVPRTLYVYSARWRKPKSLFFVIAGMDYREVEELRPGEYLTVSCVYIKNIRVQSWYKTYSIPLFKYMGNSPTLGVGGELMYYD